MSQPSSPFIAAKSNKTTVGNMREGPVSQGFPQGGLRMQQNQHAVMCVLHTPPIPAPRSTHSERAQFVTQLPVTRLSFGSAVPSAPQLGQGTAGDRQLVSVWGEWDKMIAHCPICFLLEQGNKHFMWVTEDRTVCFCHTPLA